LCQIKLKFFKKVSWFTRTKYNLAEYSEDTFFDHYALILQQTQSVQTYVFYRILNNHIQRL